jgi:hypothetical protein
MTNEMSEMLKKASIDKSTLAGTLCDLWDQNEKKIADRNGVQSCDCRVSWIGGVPVAKERPEEFAEIFGSETARGLLSRIILGYSATKFNYKHWEPPAHEISVASEGDYDFTSHIEAPNVSRMSDEAQQMVDAWQTAADASGRLKYNLVKIALLTASCNRDAEVKPEGMAAAIPTRSVQAQRGSGYGRSQVRGAGNADVHPQGRTRTSDQLEAHRQRP